LLLLSYGSRSLLFATTIFFAAAAAVLWLGTTRSSSTAASAAEGKKNDDETTTTTQPLLHLAESFAYVVGWSVAQWLPSECSVGFRLQKAAWDRWDDASFHSSSSNTASTNATTTTTSTANNATASANSSSLEVPTANVQHFASPSELASFLESTYGKDWIRRPLLLKQLWNREKEEEEELPSSSSPGESNGDDSGSSCVGNNHNRKLSLRGLLSESLVVPYFSDATSTSSGALTPDGRAPVGDVVRSIVEDDKPYKIGSQLVLEAYPHLIVDEVAPNPVVTELFGNYFTPDSLKGSGPYRMFPALTTVPLFVAWKRKRRNATAAVATTTTSSNENVRQAQQQQQQETLPYTALHCEPIGNVAVQLSGTKRWTLVGPDHWYRLKPSAAPDGRAFFHSNRAYDDSHRLTAIPRYENVVTDAGDALWVPPWTWHQVEYVPSEHISIGASLFHFRVSEFVANNPLFALLSLPALLKELVGYNTQ